MQRHGSLAMVSPCCSSSRQITHSPASLAKTSSVVTHTHREEDKSVCTKNTDNFRQHIKRSREQQGERFGALHSRYNVELKAHKESFGDEGDALSESLPLPHENSLRMHLCPPFYTVNVSSYRALNGWCHDRKWNICSVMSLYKVQCQSGFSSKWNTWKACCVRCCFMVYVHVSIHA